MYNLPKSEYDSFFDSLRLFVIKLGLLKEENIVGATLQEITDFEKEYNIVFDKSIKSYLKYFGKNTGIGNFTYTLESIAECTQFANRRFLAKSIHRIKEIEGWSAKTEDFSNWNFIFLHYNKVASASSFVKEEEENPTVYACWSEEDISAHDFNFTNLIRTQLFWMKMHLLQGIINLFGNRIYKIPWLKFYAFFYKTNRLNTNKVTILRHEFCLKIAKIEAKEKRLLGVDEFEVEFIKFIIEEKKVDYLSSGFDPYQPLITFEDYLTDLNPKEDSHKEKIKRFFDNFCKKKSNNQNK